MSSLLDRVVAQYLDSGDFNGLLHAPASPADLEDVVALLRDGLVEVVSEEDFPNPHVRPWATRRTVEAQVESLRRAMAREIGLCLYPTEAALASRVPPTLFAESPFSRRLALGAGQLDSAFFRFDVLEPYRNDPRFRFEPHDVGVDISISDDEYVDPNTPDLDKTAIHHVGFAYDVKSLKGDTPIIRRVCAALTDLAGLTPEHQQRWRTYEVPASETLQPHPVWLGIQAGDWPDGLGAFDRLIEELRAWNELHRGAFGVDLLRRLDRPRELSWVLRPSQSEFDGFIHHLDKLLSENLENSALNAMGAPERDAQGQKLGTLKRLDGFLQRQDLADDERARIMAPLYTVRAARNKPAHAPRTNVTDVTLVRTQAEVLRDVTRSVHALRAFWARHPKNADWECPEILLPGKPHYWL